MNCFVVLCQALCWRSRIQMWVRQTPAQYLVGKIVCQFGLLCLVFFATRPGLWNSCLMLAGGRVALFWGCDRDYAVIAPAKPSGYTVSPFTHCRASWFQGLAIVSKGAKADVQMFIGDTHVYILRRHWRDWLLVLQEARQFPSQAVLNDCSSAWCVGSVDFSRFLSIARGMWSHHCSFFLQHMMRNIFLCSYFPIIPPYLPPHRVFLVAQTGLEVTL